MGQISYVPKYNKYGKSGWFSESQRHSLARQGIKTGRTSSTLNFCKVNYYLPKLVHSNIPYASEVSFFANPNNASIITASRKFLGKGWYLYRVGDYVKKSRDGGLLVTFIKEKYPNYEGVSLFSETSYHSPLNEPEKITNYGTHNYNLQYSHYIPIGNYKLEQPVKNELKKGFGKEINNVEMLKWDYIVLDWKPEENTTKLFIRHKQSTPFDKGQGGKVLYESREYDISEKDKAIKDFKDYVRKFQVGHPEGKW
jgi:hypothetical protein